MQTVLVLLVAFVAGIEGILDEFEFHQPIDACTLIGLVTNHLAAGLLLGGSLQLIALGWANIGAAVAPDVCLASVISSILMIHGLESAIEARYVIAFSIALAIPLSLVGLSLTKVCRNLAIQLVHKMDETKKVSYYQWIGICMIVVHGQQQTIIPEHKINSHRGLLYNLPLQIRIGIPGQIRSRTENIASCKITIYITCQVTDILITVTTK